MSTKKDTTNNIKDKEVAVEKGGKAPNKKTRSKKRKDDIKTKNVGIKSIIEHDPIANEQILDSDLVEISIAELIDVLGSTIKYDDANKAILFVVMLSAYTEEDQLNALLLGLSASGKTFLVSEISKYFPWFDVKRFDTVSPQSFKYYNIVTDEATGLQCSDIERKILIFSEMPHSELLKNLRPVLSHDNKLCRFMTTNKNKSGRNTVDDIHIKGFAATIFCSANTSNIDTQESSRSILISPEVTPEKIEASLNSIQIKTSDKEAYNDFVNNDEKRKSLMRRIRYIKNMKIQHIKINDEDSKLILERFKKFVGKHPASRSVRDLDHLYSVIKAISLLNAKNRVNDKNDVVVDESDIEAGFKLWEKIGTPQLYGVTPYLYEDVYQKVIVPAWLEQKEAARYDDVIGLTRNDIEEKYFKVHNRMLRADELRKNIIPPLALCGLISETKHPQDKKYKLITPNVINGEHIDHQDGEAGQVITQEYADIVKEVFDEKASQ
jgi:hypothetical protein